MWNCLLFDDLFFVIYWKSVLDTKLYKEVNSESNFV